MPACLHFLAPSVGTIRVAAQTNFESRHESAMPKLFERDVGDGIVAQHVPLRTIIQFFDVWQDRDTKPSRDVKRTIDQVRAA